LKSIKKTDLSAEEALKIVKALKDRGLIEITAVRTTGKEAVPFVKFLEDFWDYDRSEYIRDRLAHGYRFSRLYARGCQNRIKAETVLKELKHLGFLKGYILVPLVLR
jgi:hypothetical protein